MTRHLKRLALAVVAATALTGAGYALAGVAIPPDEPLCLRNANNGCDNNGCEATGGVCGRAFTNSKVAASPCWCLY